MGGFGDTLYKVRSTDPQDLLYECNRIFELLANRLDKIEGYRGEAQLYGVQSTNNDIVFTVPTKGIVLKDDATPANYWRIGIDSTGSLVFTNLGRNYL